MSPTNDLTEDDQHDEHTPRKPAAGVKKDDTHKAEKLTGEDDAYEPEGGDR